MKTLTGSYLRVLCVLCGGNQQPAQKIEVPFIERIDRYKRGRPALGLRRLEQHRHAVEAPIVYETSERIEPDTTLPDMLVTIDAAAERALRVVQVKDLEALHSNQPLEQFERA